MKSDAIFAMVVSALCLAFIGASFMKGPDPLITVAAVAIPVPVVGSIWEIRSDDPFQGTGPVIKVLETKDDWVRYYVGPSMPDERAPIKVFVKIYRTK